MIVLTGPLPVNVPQMTEPNTPQAPAGWYPDPANPGGHRYWDGRRWTEEEVSRVADPGWHPDPSNPGGQRYWDGRAWTDQTKGAARWLPSDPVIGLVVLIVVAAGVASAFVFHSQAETGAGSGQGSRAQRADTTEARKAARERTAICERQVGGFLTALRVLHGRLSIRIRYAEYSQELEAVRGSYDRIGFGDLAFGCLSGVALPAESAMNSYVKAGVTWNDCLMRTPCATSGVIPELQQRWSEAAQSLRAARRGLGQLAQP